MLLISSVYLTKLVIPVAIVEVLWPIVVGNGIRILKAKSFDSICNCFMGCGFRFSVFLCGVGLCNHI